MNTYKVRRRHSGITDTIEADNVSAAGDTLWFTKSGGRTYPTQAVERILVKAYAAGEWLTVTLVDE